MEFTIHVNVTGLDKLADGLAALAGKTANPSRTAPNPAGPVSVVQYNAAPPQNAAPNPALTAKGAPFNVASQPANVAPQPVGVASQPVSAAPQPGTAQNVLPAPAPTAPAAPTGARSYTKDELAQPAGAWLSADPAKTAERSAMLRALCAEFGVGSLEQLAPEHYGAFALRLRQLGVAI